MPSFFLFPFLFSVIGKVSDEKTVIVFDYQIMIVPKLNAGNEHISIYSRQKDKNLTKKYKYSPHSEKSLSDLICLLQSGVCGLKNQVKSSQLSQSKKKKKCM